MSNSTDIYWDVDGTSLQTYAFNIRTRGGSRRGTAPKRGDDQVIPMRTGRRHSRKTRDSRIITLDMWVIGAEEDGTRPTDGDVAAQFEENWTKLVDLFDQEGQFALTKRWYDEAGEDGIMVATAMAECIGGLEPQMSGPFRGEFSPELLLADPWFYTEAITIEDDDPVKGNQPTDRVVLTMSAGARATLADGRWIQNDGAGEATVDAAERTVLIGAVYANGMISRNRVDANWFTLQPGDNDITVTGGTVEIEYQAAYR